MKNALLIAGLFLGSVVAAVVVWAAVGGSGGERRAALVEPTGRGSVGSLAIEGVGGDRAALPVRSFYWHVTCCAHTYTHGRLEVLRDGDEHSPATLTWGTTRPAVHRTATLAVSVPGEGDPYLKYELTGAGFAEYHAAEYEKLALTSRNLDVRQGQGNAPAVDPSEIIGYMTVAGERRVPILGFDSGFGYSGGGYGGGALFENAVIRTPLDQSASQRMADLRAQTLLERVTIELQTSGESEPHVTYELAQNVKLVSLSDSAAAGETPTQELELTFGRILVSQGGNSACYDSVLPHTC